MPKASHRYVKSIFVALYEVSRGYYVEDIDSYDQNACASCHELFDTENGYHEFYTWQTTHHIERLCLTCIQMKQGGG